MEIEQAWKEFEGLYGQANTMSKVVAESMLDMGVDNRVIGLTGLLVGVAFAAALGWRAETVATLTGHLFKVAQEAGERVATQGEAATPGEQAAVAKMMDEAIKGAGELGKES